MSSRPYAPSRHASSAPQPQTSGTRSASRGRPCTTDCITWNGAPETDPDFAIPDLRSEETEEIHDLESSSPPRVT